ncbi:MAG: VanZ family protein [Chloroflexi bacterium]|nr:VanZ family protein [Chloroflexota bacterium]
MLIFYNRYRAGLRWLPAFCFAVAIFIFSTVPGNEVHKSYHNLEISAQTISPSSANPTQLAVTNPVTIDWLKAAHGIGYFCLGFSILYALSSQSRWSPSIAFVLCCLYSITDEFHQMFTPGRSASAQDILLDTLAALIGVTIMLGVMATKEFFNQKQAPVD